MAASRPYREALVSRIASSSEPTPTIGAIGPNVSSVATASVPGLRAISSPTTGPGPVTRLTTPGGRSASARQPARATADTAVDGAGVQTTVLPLASAGA